MIIFKIYVNIFRDSEGIQFRGRSSPGGDSTGLRHERFGQLLKRLITDGAFTEFVNICTLTISVTA